MSKVKIVFLSLVTSYILFIGVSGLDKAHTWVEVFKALFWITVGGVNLLSVREMWKNEKLS